MRARELISIIEKTLIEARADDAEIRLINDDGFKFTFIDDVVAMVDIHDEDCIDIYFQDR